MPLNSQDAAIALTFHPHNATLHIVFFGSFISPSGWVGFGINPNSPEMTGTRALIAFPDPNSGQLVLLPYIIDPSVKLQKSPLLSKPLDIHLLTTSSTLYGGKMATIHNGATIQIYATLKLVPNKTKNVHFVWNRGIYVQGYSPTIHPTNINDLSSVATIDVLSGSQAICHNNFLTLKNVHGVINAISWGVILPIGAVTARYLRHVESLGPAWFYAHAGIQLSGISLGTVGFAIGVVNVLQGFEVMGEGSSYVKLAYCLCLSTLIGVSVALEVNSLVVFCRKAKEEKMRREGLIGSSGKFSGSSHG
ncbi:hypothetical protein K7X08_025193 [Anisodus acutangulus]|uniref:Cytochrome b561 and DOMON domain-containing protein n=1 Tax=Anisodus acutangulus TaxID=402998 RepID=A0A9Q1MEA1_9SOLA|nr:hypothetical protein K7X08_025193 [Anisodus acutangulus]